MDVFDRALLRDVVAAAGKRRSLFRWAYGRRSSDGRAAMYGPGWLPGAGGAGAHGCLPQDDALCLDGAPLPTIFACRKMSCTDVGEGRAR